MPLSSKWIKCQTFSDMCHRTDTNGMRLREFTFLMVSSDMFDVIFFCSQLLVF